MRALCWNGVNDLRVETVPDPEIVNPHDAILRVTMSATCGSDPHFIDSYLPTMKPGAIINKGLTLRTAQQHGQKYMHRLREHVVKGELDPAFLATHRFSLEDAPKGYELFKKKEDGCGRAVFTS
ncbi:hypothetical protein [Corallococcus carmarthensis]|uniref:Uncharacterized protein n=1 Tax=Corallococcus carmarthensis TaxID=2316728 RepID=A0A3A8KW32_9BACT|nr:hypothetical protein [Corallococcus carmarthensis]RKH06234.1 hypothetical protein D7X32_05915 [Corallococcus carmarthensis]